MELRAHLLRSPHLSSSRPGRTPFPAFPAGTACQFRFPANPLMLLFPFKWFQLVNNLISPGKSSFPRPNTLITTTRAHSLKRTADLSHSFQPSVAGIISCFPLPWDHVHAVDARALWRPCPRSHLRSQTGANLLIGFESERSAFPSRSAAAFLLRSHSDL